MNTKKRLFIPVVLVLLLSISSVALAQDNNAQVKFFNINPVGYDSNTNTYNLRANITLDTQGTVKYVEEYYLIKDKTPVFVSSNTSYEGSLSDEGNGNYNASFGIYRPPSYGNKVYSTVKAIILFNNIRILETWLTKDKNFNDNTNTVDSQITPVQLSDQHEIREMSISSDTETVFEYSTLDTITEVGVIGTSSWRDINLRVDLYTEVPGNSYEPSSPAIVYRYFEVSSQDITSDRIQKIRPVFRVDNSWIQANNVSIIGMISWDSDNKVWVGNPTKYIDRDSQYTYFESNSSHMSLFSIIGYGQQPKNPVISATQKQPNTNNTVDTQSPLLTPEPNQSIPYTQSVQPGKPKSNKLLTDIIVLLVGILLIQFIYFYKIKK